MKEITFDRFIRWAGSGAIVLAVLLLRVRSQPSRPFWQALRLALGGKPA